MKHSRVNKMVAGLIIIAVGIGLFLDSLHLIDFNIFMLWPLVLIYFGMKLWSSARQIAGGILLALGAVFILNEWFNVNAFELVFPALFIYLGYRLIRSRNYKEDKSLQKDPGGPILPTPPPASPTATAEFSGGARETGSWQGPIMRQTDSRSTLIGDFHLTSGRFELSNLHIWHGIGAVVIDLSRALVMEEETTLVVNGWIGDVTIYVPVDLPVAVNAEVTIGDLEVFGHRQGGMNRQVIMRSEHYDTAPRKVKMAISLFIGDVDVKYI